MYRPTMRNSSSWLLAGLSLASAAAADRPDPAELSSWSLELQTPPMAITGPPASGLPFHLILDDGSRDADVGFSTDAAFQFLWFNRFASPSSAFDLNEIRILFPPGSPEIVPGAAIQLVVYRDPDGDPATGAELLAAVDETIEVVDGVTFSAYPLDPPVRLLGGGDVLIGVVNRFVTSGDSPPSRPAALDNTASAGRSWVALWSGDPPDPPLLEPDVFLGTIDFLEPGNWMIRGFGSPVPVVEIPALGPTGLACLAALLGLGGTLFLRRRSGAPPTYSVGESR